MNKWENIVCGGKDIKLAGKVKDILNIFL